ncbi:TetR/AcrR family transcriptional regulator [Lactiplantibacillus herbarum]|uniref:TetR/AcrR family transcriptional regulator n=1 Tax=Lactiplantibacillus herbarum TaxID=1670446 RepID=UPI00069CFCEC|nr:TetR/AcrR family transcriptional regulator [Lactiplantibacillus herbarum]
MLTNSRSELTKIRIQHALFTLLKQQAFSRLTTNDILSVAHVSRGTFYRYYHDKYMLLTSCESHLIHDVKAIFTKDGKPNLSKLTAANHHNAFYDLFQYIYTHGTELAVLLNCSESQITTRIHDLLDETVRLRNPQPLKLPETPKICPALAEELIDQNIITILKFWINSDFSVSPSKAYQDFLESRSLSPLNLSTLLNAS